MGQNDANATGEMVMGPNQREKESMTLIEQKMANRRPYWMALAHCIANTKGAEQERMTRLNGLFGKLSPKQQCLCRAEAMDAREAKRGNRPAEVA